MPEDILGGGGDIIGGGGGGGSSSVFTTVDAGQADSATAVQTAISNLGTDGGHIILLPGDHTWKTVPKLPKGIVGKLIVSGLGARIVLSTNGPRVFDFNHGSPVSATQETFANIELRDLYVDCNNVTGGASKSHVLIGNLISGSWQTYMNFSNITVRRCTVVNVPTSGDNNGRQVVSIVAKHAGSDEANQSTITDVTVDSVNFQGGMVGLAVMGSTGAGTSANVWLDRVSVNNFVWDSLLTPTNVGGGTAGGGIQIGGTGFGNVCHISNADIRHSWDIGIEIDAMIRSHIENVYAEDCWNSHFFATNFHVPFAQDGTTNRLNSQRATWTDCHAVINLLTPNQGSNLSQGFVGGHTGQQTFGHFIMEDCSYTSKSAVFTVQTGTGLTVNNAPINRLTVRNFNCVHDTIADTNGVTTETPTLIDLRPTTDCTIDINGLRTVVAGTSGTGMNPRMMQVASLTNGKDIRLTLRGFRPEQTLTGLSNGNTIILRFGNGTAGGTYSALIDDYRLNVWSGDANPKPLYFDPNTVNNISLRGVTFSRLDFSGSPSAAFDIGGSASNAPDTTLRPKIKVLPGCVFKSTTPDRVTTATTYAMVFTDRLVAVTSTASARTITLPGAAWVSAGTQVLIADESNAAGTNNITIAGAGSDTITGTAVISTNGGSKRLYTDGSTKWFVV